MHRHYVNREFLLMNLAVLVILCIFLLTETPTVLVILAIVMVIIGIFGWLQSWDFSHPWIARLVSTLLIGLGVWFLIWYFRIGRTIIHPIFDPQSHVESVFESIQESTPTPEGTIRE